MEADEWRVEVELDDEAHGYPLGERLRSLRLDDEARNRLGRHVIVSRDGSRLFLYARTRPATAEAERVIRALIDEDELTADVRVTRWHPIEERWKDAAEPLPRTEAEEAAERARHEEAERREAAVEGAFDWHVKLALPSRHEAVELEEELVADGLAVHRRWRYLTVGALTEDSANELGHELRGRAPEGSEIWVAVNVEELDRPAFRFVPPLT